MNIITPDSPQHFDEMWRLNHEIFCEELKQHPPHPDGRLIDKFHDKNIYRIGWDGHRVTGMICAHSQAPFSAVERFGNIFASRWVAGKTAEVRLFALRKEFRGGQYAIMLASALFHELERRGMKLILISGVESQKSLYRHLGFEILGAPVKDGESLFYPMCAKLEQLIQKNQSYRRFSL